MLKLRRINLFRSLLLILLIPATASTSNALEGTLLVVNKSEHNVSLIDFPTAREIAKIPVGANPHEVDVSPDGKTAIVSNYGSNIPGSTVSVIDIKSAKVVGLITLKDASRPHGIQWLADGKHAVVTTEGTGDLTLLDVTNRVVVNSFKTGQDISHMVVVGPDQNMAYVANIGSGSVTVIDLSGKTTRRNIKSGRGAEGIAITQDGTEVWVSNRAENTITILDAKTLEIKEKISAGEYPFRVVIASECRALVTNAVGGNIDVYDVKSRKIISRTPSYSVAKLEKKELTGNKELVPVGILVEGDDVFVANTNVGTIAHYLLPDMKPVGILSAGLQSDGLAFSPIRVSSK